MHHPVSAILMAKHNYLSGLCPSNFNFLNNPILTYLLVFKLQFFALRLTVARRIAACILFSVQRSYLLRHRARLSSRICVESGPLNAGHGTVGGTN